MREVSFVVPCYNYGHFLRDCLESILNQEGGFDFEIIAVNDGSTDSTAEVLHAYREKGVKVIDRQENRGHVYTVNEGLKSACGKYVSRIDPDDRLHRKFLIKTVPILMNSPEVGLVYGNVNLIDSQGEVTKKSAMCVHGADDFKGNEFISLLRLNHICAPSVLARREAWMSAYPIPDGLAFNDWYFNIMLARKWEYYYISDVIADYRVHDSNWHTKVSKDKTEETSTFALLDRIYSEIEIDPSLEKQKRIAKKTIYAAHYQMFADKYFGHAMYEDARRCVKRALQLQPSLILQRRVLKRFMATFVLRARSARSRASAENNVTV